MSLRTASSSFTKRKRTYLTLETKLEILGRAESGEGSSALGRMFGVGESTIRSIKKNADKIKNSVLYSSPFSGTVTRIGNTALKRTEKVLGTWITKQLQNKKFSLSTICIRDKALAIYERFVQDQGGSYEPFVASKGWLNNFLKRTGFDSLKAGPSNQVFSGKPENPRRKKIAAATVSSAPVLIPDDSPPQPSPAKIQKKQIDDRRFDEQRFQEQRFQERRFENRRFDDRRQMVNTQVSQMAAKTLQAQMPVQQHMSVAQVSQNITRPVQVLAPPIQISEPKPKPVEKPRPREKRIFVVADHQRCVMSNLASLWKSGKLCDAGIGNGSSTVMVHKVVLSAVCPKLLSVFSTDILSHKFLQVNFPEEVSTEALNAFAEYMYNGLLDIDPDILHQLKIIAKRLDMKEFEQLCDSRLPSTIPQQPASTVTVFGDLSQMQTILSNPPSITVPTVQPSLPSSSITSVTSQSAPSVTTQVIDVKQEISEAELAQVKKDTAAVFGQESEVASLDASKSGNSSGGFVIVPSVKTEPVGPEDDRYGQLNNQSYASTPVSISSRIPGTGLNSTVVSSSEFVLPFSDTTDSNTTNVLQGTSKLKSNVFESSLVSDLSPVSCIVEKMCSQSSPIREDPSKPLNRTITTQSIDNIVTSGSNEGVYPVGLFTAGGDSLPLSSTQVTNVKNIGLYKTDGLT
ncbi:uncharacterized protein LOC106877732 isoform X14 [Octopus bimaculoides]|uniref:uncharacterized protein LOC106877732 isoform X14 n=1 Tax=Octopus bimaculoides TaxID=37653 RepID=UPI00071D1E93|nr:uncharacterized protein LOC106877732 isoform X14 [Octopus bimaculoides]|eukprot:XP_014782204.1 PREDICTED: uncharacterized protein LOC106877732 isoform X14 [Octopus bimaculoides]